VVFNRVYNDTRSVIIADLGAWMMTAMAKA